MLIQLLMTIDGVGWTWVNIFHRSWQGLIHPSIYRGEEKKDWVMDPPWALQNGNTNTARYFPEKEYQTIHSWVWVVIQIVLEYKMWKAIRRCFSRTLTRNETLSESKKGWRFCKNLSAEAGMVKYSCNWVWKLKPKICPFCWFSDILTKQLRRWLS